MYPDKSQQIHRQYSQRPRDVDRIKFAVVDLTKPYLIPRYLKIHDIVYPIEFISIAINSHCSACVNPALNFPFNLVNLNDNNWDWSSHELPD